VESVLSPHSSPAINPGHSSNGFPQLTETMPPSNSQTTYTQVQIRIAPAVGMSRSWKIISLLFRTDTFRRLMIP
jgi:hypothetical protein